MTYFDFIIWKNLYFIVYIVDVQRQRLSTRDLLFYLILLIIAVYLIGFFSQNMRFFLIIFP